MLVKLVKFSRTFLDLSWNWLNNDELRFLTNTPVFSRADQIEWFNNLEFRQDYKIWGIKADNIPLGACGLKNINEVEGEYWGYIGIKEYRSKGLGTQIMLLIEKKAKRLNLGSMWLRVIPQNIPAINLYLKSGYKIERKDVNFLYLRKYLSGSNKF